MGRYQGQKDLEEMKKGNQMRIRIFTDGACSENPGPGGWSAVIATKEGTQILKGFEGDTTNNRMELMAVVRVLSHIMASGISGFNPAKDKIEIHSDSAYVINAINDKWTIKWKLNGWKTTKGKDVKNRDLWEEFMSLMMAFKSSKMSVQFVKVKGHKGVALNELADQIAKEQVNIAKSAIQAGNALEDAIS